MENSTRFRNVRDQSLRTNLLNQYYSQAMLQEDFSVAVEMSTFIITFTRRSTCFNVHHS